MSNEQDLTPAEYEELCRDIGKRCGPQMRVSLASMVKFYKLDVWESYGEPREVAVMDRLVAQGLVERGGKGDRTWRILPLGLDVVRVNGWLALVEPKGK